MKRKPSKYKLQNSVYAKIGKKLKRKKGELIEYHKTGVEGDAASIDFKDADISTYKEMHLIAIGKPLYAMGYNIDLIYGDAMQATKILLKRREHNDRKHLEKMKKAKSTLPLLWKYLDLSRSMGNKK